MYHDTRKPGMGMLGGLPLLFTLLPRKPGWCFPVPQPCSPVFPCSSSSTCLGSQLFSSFLLSGKHLFVKPASKYHHIYESTVDLLHGQKCVLWFYRTPRATKHHASKLATVHPNKCLLGRWMDDVRPLRFRNSFYSPLGSPLWLRLIPSPHFSNVDSVAPDYILLAVWMYLFLEYEFKKKN